MSPRVRVPHPFRRKGWVYSASGIPHPFDPTIADRRSGAPMPQGFGAQARWKRGGPHPGGCGPPCLPLRGGSTQSCQSPATLPPAPQLGCGGRVPPMFASLPSRSFVVVFRAEVFLKEPATWTTRRSRSLKQPSLAGGAYSHDGASPQEAIEIQQMPYRSAGYCLRVVATYGNSLLRRELHI